MLLLEKKLNISGFIYFLYETWKFAGLSALHVCFVQSLVTKIGLKLSDKGTLMQILSSLHCIFSLCTLLNPFLEEFKVKIIVFGQNI